MKILMGIMGSISIVVLLLFIQEIRKEDPQALFSSSVVSYTVFPHSSCASLNSTVSSLIYR